jgi:hypothetical protein
VCGREIRGKGRCIENDATSWKGFVTYSRASLVEVTDEGVLELGPDAVHVKTGGDGELQPDPGFDWVEETGRDPVSAGRYGTLVAMVSK